MKKKLIHQRLKEARNSDYRYTAIAHMKIIELLEKILDRLEE